MNDARLSLHERCRDLHNHRLYAISRTPALLGEQFHTDGAARQHVATLDDRRHHADKGRREGKRRFKVQRELNARRLALFRAQRRQVFSQLRVGVDF